jgi:hypothetical protein
MPPRSRAPAPRPPLPPTPTRSSRARPQRAARRTAQPNPTAARPLARAARVTCPRARCNAAPAASGRAFLPFCPLVAARRCTGRVPGVPATLARIAPGSHTLLLLLLHDSAARCWDQRKAIVARWSRREAGPGTFLPSPGGSVSAGARLAG